MNERTKEKIINGLHYKFLHPPVMQSFPLVTRVLPVLGPLLAPFFEILRGGAIKDEKLDIKSLNVEVFANALGSAPAEKINALLMDSWVISKLHCNNTPISDNLSFEQHFGQYPENLFPVLSWILWEIVNPFFPKLEGFTQKLSNMTTNSGLQSRTDGSKIGG